MANTPTSYTAESFPLAKGMQGENIKVLQTALGVEADGKFWNATETALKNLYNVTTCSEELFKQITGQKTKNKGGFMANLNLSEKAKKGIKIGAIILGIAGVSFLGYQLISGNNKKSVSSSSASGKTAAAALNGTKKPKKSKKSSKKSKKSGKKVLALQ